MQTLNMIKDSSFNPSGDADEKYRNEDYIMEMLVERNQKELEKIKQVHNLSDEQIGLFCDFARLRADTLKKMKQELEERKASNRKASREESDMGAYLEEIEPQVREAVLAFRRKGYTTYLSGFSGFDSQKIGFEEEHMKDYAAPEKLKADLRQEGAELIVGPRSVEIKFSKFLDLKKIEAIWRRVADELPPLDRKVEPTKIKAAEIFREKQRAMRDARP